MANINFKLEEQLSDQRSDQIAYKVTIENSDSKAIRLISVEPRVPRGASLLEVTDTSLAEANATKADLVAELNQLLRQFLWVVSDPFRQAWVAREREGLKQVLSVSGFLYIYFHLVFNNKKLQARMKREFQSFAFKVSSASDARSAYSRWMEEESGNEAIRSLFVAKTEQLERVEARMGEGDKDSLTSIEPGSYFTATYVIKFARGLLEPKKYQVGFDATYQEFESSLLRSASTATSIQVSPYPFVLSIVAIISAILGIVVRASLGGSQDPLSDVIRMAASGQILVGPIVALIFFNVYEYTSLGKEFGMSVSWRSALLIGSLCGMAQDRILAALKALIGA